MKKTNKIVDKILEELEKTPLVQFACEKVGISRNTFYRWMKEDTSFRKRVSESISLGTGVVNDFAVSNVLTSIQNKDPIMTKYWLDRRHPDFRKPYRIEIDPHDLLLYEKFVEEKERIMRAEQEASSKVHIVNQKDKERAVKKAREMLDKWIEKDKPKGKK